MAMMDNREFLISHIRNSFITSDDTGMCELILECDEAADRMSVGTDKRPTTWHGTREDHGGSFSDSGLDSDSELSHSSDIVPDMDFESHRRRSNTAQRLEKLKKERHKQSKIKHIPWKDTMYSVDEMGEYFVKKEVKTTSPKPKQYSSALTMQLEQMGSVPRNPYIEYAKFDGKGISGVSTKKIGIFLTMAGPEDRAYPMAVTTLATAKVSDLIGLICWQYNVEGREPKIKGEGPDNYALHIAEDDGEVDMDFPALDSKEPISKFDFARLALVVKSAPDIPKTSKIYVTIHTGHGFSEMPVESDSVLMKEILVKALERRKLKQRPGLEYRLEKKNDAGKPIDLEKPLSALNTLNLVMVRENSVRSDIEVEADMDDMNEMTASLSSHQYKSFIVHLQQKLGRSLEVQLGVSGEKMEMDPVQGKGWIFKQKAITYDMDSIASCVILQNKEKTTGKCTFRLVYHGVHNDFKHHDFEGESVTVKEIIRKVNNIMEMRASPIRKDYKVYKDRKKQNLLKLKKYSSSVS